MERSPSFKRRATELSKKAIVLGIKEAAEHLPLNYSMVGEEYIAEARKLLAQKKTVVAALDHHGYADLTSGACVGLKRHFDDLVQYAAIVMSVRYLKNFPTNFLPEYFNVIPVVPHTMPDYPNREEINRQAIEKAQNIPDGSLLVVTPEGTSNRQAAMLEVRFGSERFWHGVGERSLIHIAIEGSEEQWPRGLGVAGGGAYYFAYGRWFKKIKFIFGEPTPVETIDSIAQRLAKNPEDFERLKSEVVMAGIARLHIEKGDSKYAGRYADLARELQKIRD